MMIYNKNDSWYYPITFLRFIFNLFLPFLEVCILVRKETLRLDNAPINHHGKVGRNNSENIIMKGIWQAVLPSEMEGATESEKNQLKEKEEKKKGKMNSVGFEDLDGTGATQSKLDPEKNKTVFMNLIHVDEQAQVLKIQDNFN